MVDALARHMPEHDSVPELHIDVARAEDRLKVSATEQFPGDVSTVRHYEDLTIPLEAVNVRCGEIVRMLNTANRRGRITPDILVKIRETGQMLTDDLFPPHVKETLRTTRAEHLIFHLDDRMVHIPWELLHDGESFICRRFAIGRLVSTRQRTFASASHRTVQGPMKLLILADPAGDLKNAYAEGVELRDRMDRRRGAVEAALCSDNITPEFLRERLRRFDLVHFAGHCDYDAKNPARSGWRLTNGHLYAEEIMKMAGNGTMPAFIFSNGCQSARTGEWAIRDRFNDEIFGLANAFILSGVKHYLGTFWEMPDEPCRKYAASFYPLLLDGESVGMAVRNARESLIKTYGEETIVWASYLLYGDPRFRYAPKPAPAGLSRPAPPRLEKIVTEIRGKLSEREEIIDFGKRTPPRQHKWRARSPANIDTLAKAFALFRRSSLTFRVAAVLFPAMLLWWGAPGLFTTDASGSAQRAALAQYHAGDFDGALAATESLIRRNTGLGLAYLIRGDILLRRGDAKAAKSAFQRAIDAADGTVDQISQALLGLGRIASIFNRSGGRPDEALAYYEKAASANPEAGEAYLYQGMVLSEKGEDAAALAALRRAQRRMPDDPGVAAMVRQTEKRVRHALDKERRACVDRLVRELTERIDQEGISPAEAERDTDTVTIWVIPPEEIGYGSLEGASILFGAGLSDALLPLENIRLVERDILDALLAELQLGTSRLADRTTALSLGRIMAARLILTGRIVHGEAERQVSVRLIETETGEIIGTASRILKADAPIYPSGKDIAGEMRKAIENRFFPETDISD